MDPLSPLSGDSTRASWNGIFTSGPFTYMGHQLLNMTGMGVRIRLIQSQTLSTGWILPLKIFWSTSLCLVLSHDWETLPSEVDHIITCATYTELFKLRGNTEVRPNQSSQRNPNLSLPSKLWKLVSSEGICKAICCNVIFTYLIAVWTSDWFLSPWPSVLSISECLQTYIRGNTSSLSSY